MNNFKPSKVWDKINNTLLHENNNVDYSDFREPNKINKKITTWNPYEPTLRYFKYFLNHIVFTSSEEFFETYSKVKNTNLGNPIAIKYKNIDYNLDYILSINEILFIKDILNKSKTICEIGAGFGRTPHSIIEVFDNIEKYYIIDLPNCLNLTKNYLNKVLTPQQYSKCEFISTDNLKIETFPKVDLFINIDSFAEMDEEIIFNYLKLIYTSSEFFYCKNPIGKYTPKDIGLLEYNNEDLDNIFNTGLCRDTLNIFNDEDLYLNLQKYIEKYNPDKSSHIIKYELASPFYFYGNVLYKIKNDK